MNDFLQALKGFVAHVGEALGGGGILGTEKQDVLSLIDVIRLAELRSHRVEPLGGEFGPEQKDRRVVLIGLNRLSDKGPVDAGKIAGEFDGVGNCVEAKVYALQRRLRGISGGL